MIDAENPIPYSVVVFRDPDNIQLELFVDDPPALFRGLAAQLEAEAYIVANGTPRQQKTAPSTAQTRARPHNSARSTTPASA